MKTLEKSLDPEAFLRIHRSLIVNLHHGEYRLLLASGVRLHSGRTYHERLKALVANPF